MSEAPETIEDAAAGILNGLMIFLLGATVPGLIIWQVISHWGAPLMGLRAETTLPTLQFVALLGFSFMFMRTGFNLARKNLLALRARRSPPTA